MAAEALIRARGTLSQTDFASRLSRELGRPLTRSMLSEYEAGDVEPRAAILIAAARVADRSVDGIVSGAADVDHKDRILRETRAALRQMRELLDLAGYGEAIEGFPTAEIDIPHDRGIAS